MTRSLFAVALLAAVPGAAAAQTTLFELGPKPFEPSFGLLATGSAGDVDGDGRPDVLLGAPGLFGNGYARLVCGDTGVAIEDFQSSYVGARIGAAVATVGDVNGDGFDDFAIGDTEDFGPGGDIGSVRVYSGKTRQELYMKQGIKELDNFGCAIAGGVDFTGDGVPDFAVGVRQFDALYQLNVIGPGRVGLFKGRKGGLFGNLLAPAGASGFGTAVAFFGDASGDAVSDLLVGSPGRMADVPGTVYAYSAADKALLWSVTGDAVGDELGRAVAAVGDLDGDGTPDVVAGAPQQPWTVADPSLAGYARVLSGEDGALLRELVGDPGTNAFGQAVAGPGDMDQDGFPDYVVAGDSYGRLYSGRSGRVLLELGDEDVAASYHVSIAGAGDVNLDGWPDLLVATGQSTKVLTLAHVPLTSDLFQLSAFQGGEVGLELDAGPDFALAPYGVLGSASGTTPGTTFVGAPLPLNPDRWFELTLEAPTQPAFQGFRGLLSRAGTASASFTLPPSAEARLAGVTLHHAFVALDPSSAGVLVSNTVPLTLFADFPAPTAAPTVHVDEDFEGGAPGWALGDGLWHLSQAGDCGLPSGVAAFDDGPGSCESAHGSQSFAFGILRSPSFPITPWNTALSFDYRLGVDLSSFDTVDVIARTSEGQSLVLADERDLVNSGSFETALLALPAFFPEGGGPVTACIEFQVHTGVGRKGGFQIDNVRVADL